MTTILLIIHLWTIQAGFATVQGDTSVIEESRHPLRDPIPYATLTVEKAMAMCGKIKQESRSLRSVQVECRLYEVHVQSKTKDHAEIVSIHRIGGEDIIR